MSDAVNSQAEILPAKAAAVSRATSKQRFVTVGFFCNNCRRDARLAVRVRLDRRCDCEKADGLIQIFDELQGFHCQAADHDPERQVYFQRDRHRASPLFDFRGTRSN
jgi:hypothetical protein